MTWGCPLASGMGVTLIPCLCGAPPNDPGDGQMRGGEAALSLTRGIVAGAYTPAQCHPPANPLCLCAFVVQPSPPHPQPRSRWARGAEVGGEASCPLTRGIVAGAYTPAQCHPPANPSCLCAFVVQPSPPHPRPRTRWERGAPSPPAPLPLGAGSRSGR